MTKVTVISPYHNRKSSVRMTLTSISSQTFEDFEALIWDDGSTDGTFEELQKVQAELGDPRITVYQHMPNIGLTNGLNDAIQRAKGDYIAVVGSGDTCAPDRLEKQVAALEADQEARFCACRSVTIDEVSGRQFSDEHFQNVRIEKENVAEVCPFTHGSVMYRKKAILAVGGYDPIFKWCADWDLFFRLLNTGHACYIPEDLYFRYARMDGVSFAPQKSVEQIKSKHLVLCLAGLSNDDREALKTRVANQGLKEALSGCWVDIARDLRARQIKLIFMGRKEAGEELGKLIDAEFGTSLKWNAAAVFAKIIEASPINQDKAIAFARKIKSLF
ncbi:glycosyltransferase family 2 protein [Celeribacter sp.]|uniref:glycosyltransferase family 2 protein n=1 Tax=Celeribacter sp. TaxID=1890673 RepID=UPI003A952C38